MSATAILASFLFLLVGILSTLGVIELIKLMKRENERSLEADDFIRKKLGPKDYLYWLDLSMGRPQINNKEVKK